MHVMYGSAAQSPTTSRPAGSGRSTSEPTTNGVQNNGYSQASVTSVLPSSLGNPLGTALLHTSYAPSLHHAPKPHLTPAAFQGRKLRSGKWIKEEEDYAELLISLFERGQVEDCENGCTLRSFLSRKLHCAPMRISKKYAGKGIGKMVYLSKLNVGISISGEEHKATTARVKTTEERFFKAVFPGSDYHDVSHSFFSLYARFSLTQILIRLCCFSCPPLQPFEAYTRESTKAGAATGPFHPGVLPARFPYQIPGNVSKSSHPVSAPTPTMGSGTVQTRVQPAPETAPKNATAPIDQTKMLHQSFMNALNQESPASVAATTAPQVIPIGASRTPLARPTQHAQASAPAVSQGAAPETNEVPDFLAGFDNVTSNLKHGTAQGKSTTDASPTGGIPQYSPPFTSQSFDDFHRLLGKDLSPLDETADQKTSASSTRDRQQPHSSLAASAQTSQSIREIDTMALFNAESYAMFAQESAIAASQHAAYFQPGDAGLNPMYSLDAEGLMSVISGQIEDRQQYASQQNVQPMPSQAISLSGTRISSNGLTPVERLYGELDMNVVSGSEPSSSATETESTVLSMRESLSDRDVSDNASNDCTNDNDFSSNDSESASSDCQSDDSPQQRKRLKRTTVTVSKRDVGIELS
jgi:hypothetical protein